MFCSCVDVDGCPCLSASTTLIRLLFKHFYSLVHTSLWQTVLSILGSQLMGLGPFHAFRHKKMHCCMLLVLGAVSSGTVIFTPCLLGTNGLYLNHTRSTSKSDLERQNDQVRVVLPITQRKYFNITLTFDISFVIPNHLVIISYLYQTERCI
jgi:hypothetical protein